MSKNNFDAGKKISVDISTEEICATKRGDCLSQKLQI